jgi:hypothetical protein
MNESDEVKLCITGVPVKMYRRLKAEAQRQHSSMCAVVRRALAVYLDARGTPDPGGGERCRALGTAFCAHCPCPAPTCQDWACGECKGRHDGSCACWNPELRVAHGFDQAYRRWQLRRANEQHLLRTMKRRAARRIQDMWGG